MKLRISLKTYNKGLLYIAISHVYAISLQLSVNSTKPVFLPKKIKQFCILRSPHINKDAREQFEIRSFKAFVDLDLDSNVVHVLSRLINFNLPASIRPKVTIL
jgi:small subunit ribosomal protein S10